MPKGPHTTEINTWVLVNKSASYEIKEKYRKGVMRTFSPSVMTVVHTSGTPAVPDLTQITLNDLVRREAVRKGLARSGRKVAEPLQFMPMMACVLRGRLRFCAVFLTPPAPPNALQRTLLA